MNLITLHRIHTDFLRITYYVNYTGTGHPDQERNSSFTQRMQKYCVLAIVASKRKTRAVSGTFFSCRSSRFWKYQLTRIIKRQPLTKIADGEATIDPVLQAR